MMNAAICGDALLHEIYGQALADLHACSLTLDDQWRWIIGETVQRTGLPADAVEADLREQGFVPTGVELADDEVCEAIVTGSLRRLDGAELPHNHVATLESWPDMAARIASRLDRINSGATPRARALAEIGLVHRVDAYVAARALAHFGQVAADGGPNAIGAAGLFIAAESHTEH